MDEILDEADLPVRYVGYSSCFRREAGAAGKDTRGIFRVHQFDKVEMFSFCAPDKSPEEHDFMRSIEEEVLQELGLPYRAVNIAAGDLGAPAAKKYDLEAWLPTQERYREVTSCSNCTDYQARRLKVRAKGEKGGPYLLHTLNGTVVAVGRTIIAIMENYQTEDGHGRGAGGAAALPARRHGGARADERPVSGDRPARGRRRGARRDDPHRRARRLIVVDVQRDFCPAALCRCPDGDEVIPVINRLLPMLRPLDLHPRLASRRSRELLATSPSSATAPGPPTPCRARRARLGATGLEMPMNAILVSKGDDPAVGGVQRLPGGPARPGRVPAPAQGGAGLHHRAGHRLLRPPDRRSTPARPGSPCSWSRTRCAAWRPRPTAAGLRRAWRRPESSGSRSDQLEDSGERPARRLRRARQPGDHDD